jgi:hypothetical protein
MLKDPFLNCEYSPSIAEFVGIFDIYDLEDTLGAELEKYDINSKNDRAELIIKYITSGCKWLNYRHRYALTTTLKKALDDKKYDFQKLLEHDYDSHNSLPSYWDEMASPRDFFQEIYDAINRDWKEDLAAAEQENSTTREQHKTSIP